MPVRPHYILGNVRDRKTPLTITYFVFSFPLGSQMYSSEIGIILPYYKEDQNLDGKNDLLKMTKLVRDL